MLAPTKPLVEQHLRFFEKYLIIRDQKDPHLSPFVMFTGDAPPDERTADWNRATVILATPQVIKNDLIAGRYTLSDVTLLIVDECHRSVGNYAYVFLAQRYLATAGKPLLLAMTASPGGVQEKVQEVCTNLGIAHIETRTEFDPDVAPYVHEREINFISIDLPAELRTEINSINSLIEKRLALPCIPSLYRTETRKAVDERAQCNQLPDPATDPEPRSGRILCSVRVRGVHEV